jgi:inorganic phosphate transporter, PiT family
MENLSLYVIIIIAVAFFFDYINGFHDAANSVATVVSTRVLRPAYAVVWAAFFDFIAAFVFPTHVAKMVGQGIVRSDIPGVVTNELILAALLGAILWDLFTWYLALPTSSSHALIGGLVGAAVVKSGFSSLQSHDLIIIVLFIALSPLIGLALGYFLRALMSRIFQHSTPKFMAPHFRRLQLISAGLYSLGHGTNDAQKTMGIIALLIALQHGPIPAGGLVIPSWVKIAACAAISLGTLSGGWRIIKTMGMNITKLQPVDGFCAELAAAASLFGTSAAGIPVSTTHTITGAIVGVGSVRRLSAVRWGVTINVMWAWVMTIPGAAIIAILVRLLLDLIVK